MERVTTRQAHEFTDESATIHMHKEFVKSEIDPRHVFNDPPDGVEAVVDQIVSELGSNSLVYKSRDMTALISRRSDHGFGSTSS